MAKNDNEKPTASAQNEPASAPELTRGGRSVPQLVRSTKSTRIIPVTPDDPDPWSNNTDEEASDFANNKEPQVRGYGEPLADRDDDDKLNEHVDDPADPDGVHEGRRERWQQTQTLQPAPSAKKAKKHHPFLKTLLFLVLLAAATVGAYWLGNHQAEKNNPTSSSTPTKPAATTPAPKQTPIATLKHYNSTNYSLNFDYPSDWKLTDTTSKLTVASPELQLPAADGTTKNGQVVFTMQPKQTSIAGYPASGAKAVLASNRATYTKPSSAQRASTYLSYLGYSSSTGLDEIFVTGDNAYQPNQTVPQTDLTKSDPLIHVEFLSCNDASCTGDSNSVLTLLASKWQSLPVATTLTSIIKSIQLD